MAIRLSDFVDFIKDKGVHTETVVTNQMIASAIKQSQPGGVDALRLRAALGCDQARRNISNRCLDATRTDR